jgi:hypothetical protein
MRGVTGKILVEEATGELVQSDDALVGFPAGFAWTRVEQETVWDQVKIGEDGRLLPVSSSQGGSFLQRSFGGDTDSVRESPDFEAKSNIIQ